MPNTTEEKTEAVTEEKKPGVISRAYSTVKENITLKNSGMFLGGVVVMKFGPDMIEKGKDLLGMSQPSASAMGQSATVVKLK